MNKLTPKIAEDFAKEKFRLIQSEEDRDFNLVHSEAVVRCALILSEDKKVNLEILEIAGWLHDIGKTIEIDDHAKHTIEILEKEGFEVSDKLKDCILNHGTGGSPKSEEAKIIAVADKASIIDRDMLNIISKYTLQKSKSERKEDLEFIKKLADKGADLLIEY